MSTLSGPSLVAQPEPPKEIREPIDAYRDAHTNYLLAVGALAFWELIGISLEGNIGRGFQIESPPKWIMLVLLIVVIYCGYKMTTKWMLCNPECRTRLAAKWNPRTAHGIALIAIAISIIQYLLHIQIADYVSHHQVQSFVVLAGVMTAVGAFPIYSMHALRNYDLKDPKIPRSLPALAISAPVISCIESIQHGNPSLFFVTLPIVIAAWVIYRNRKKTEATKA